MKQKFLTICAAAFLFVACNNDEKTADAKMDDSKKDDASAMASKDKMDEKGPETYTTPDTATAMKNWMAYASPGDAHKMLAKSNGVWASEITFWEMPGGPAQKATGTMTTKMVMDGRYQVSTFSSKMMGMPFEGMSTTAYDNAKKSIVSTWIDNMGTGLMIMEGPWDDASKSATLVGKTYDPGAGRELTHKEVFKMVDDNTQTMEMYKPAPDGKEFKCLEIKYTRKK